MIGGGAAADFVMSVGISQKLSAAKDGDKSDIVNALRPAVAWFHARPFPESAAPILQGLTRWTLHAGRRHHCRNPSTVMMAVPTSKA